MLRSLNIVVAIAAALVGSLPFAASGQTSTVRGAPIVSGPTIPNGAKVESFRSRLQDQQKTLESYGATISGLVDRLKAASGTTVERAMRETG